MTKTERRIAMPIVSKFIDSIREHFGEPVFIKAQENSHEVNWGIPAIDRSGMVEIIPVVSGKRRK